MKEKRITPGAGGGSRRHGDPPAWLDTTLPLEQRRELLDRAIRELDSEPRSLRPLVAQPPLREDKGKK